MTITFVIQHELQASVEQFWSEIFESEEFNRALYVDRLGFRYELELWDPATGHRRARVWVTDGVPKPFAGVLGNKVGFVEEGTYDDEAERYDFRVIPSALSRRIPIKGTVVTAPLSERTCERLVTFEIEVRVLGVGPAIEKFLETRMREQYDVNANFINEYLAAKS
jgi:hypothetical protein